MHDQGCWKRAKPAEMHSRNTVKLLLCNAYFTTTLIDYSALTSCAELKRFLFEFLTPLESLMIWIRVGLRALNNSSHQLVMVGNLTKLKTQLYHFQNTLLKP